MLMTVLKGDLATKQSLAYRFQLSKEETILIQRSKNLTAEIWATNKGWRTRLPYAFTEQGIYMLMTVLKGVFDTNV